MSSKNSTILDKATVEENKKTIINLFNMKIKGKKSNVLRSNSRHDGKHGHWLEKTMGIAFNASNSPDILGFEMKNATNSKTSFGDWSGDYRIFVIKKGGELTYDEFFEIFGKPSTDETKPEKLGRYSWSGSICPNKVGPFNKYGQKLLVDDANNVLAIYSYDFDQRSDKSDIVPDKYKTGEVLLEKWSSELLRKRVESKFNQNGWFKCEKDKSGVYNSIVFGAPITFETWIEFVKQGNVIFDCGMYQSVKKPYKPYHNWRASNKFWDNLVISRH